MVDFPENHDDTVQAIPQQTYERSQDEYTKHSKKYLTTT
jgi:hypothetical protein